MASGENGAEPKPRQRVGDVMRQASMSMLDAKGYQTRLGTLLLEGASTSAESSKALPKNMLIPQPNQILPGGGEIKKLSGAHHSATVFFLGTSSGQWLMLLVIGCACVFGGAFLWKVAERCEDGVDVNTGSECLDRPADILWTSWGMFIDIGTHTGIDMKASHMHRLISVVISLLGFMFSLVVLGLIVELVRYQLEIWQRAFGMIIANRHTVVLGWTDKTLFILPELAQMLLDSSEKGGKVHSTARGHIAAEMGSLVIFEPRPAVPLHRSPRCRQLNTARGDAVPGLMLHPPICSLPYRLP